MWICCLCLRVVTPLSKTNLFPILLFEGVIFSFSELPQCFSSLWDMWCAVKASLFYFLKTGSFQYWQKRTGGERDCSCFSVCFPRLALKVFGRNVISTALACFSRTFGRIRLCVCVCVHWWLAGLVCMYPCKVLAQQIQFQQSMFKAA